jgi:hypothetical protein
VYCLASVLLYCGQVENSNVSPDYYIGSVVGVFVIGHAIASIVSMFREREEQKAIEEQVCVRARA